MEKEEKLEKKPKLRRVMSGAGMVGLGRRDVWKPMGLGWNLAIKAHSPRAKEFPSSQALEVGDGDKEM